jgi:hypothetical protein
MLRIFKQEKAVREIEEACVHRWRLARSSQFPNALKCLRDDTIAPLISGWIVNIAL